MRIEHQILIEAPTSIVFALNTGIETWPALTPTVTSVTRLDQGPLQVGSQALVKQPGQRPTVWTVGILEPDHKFQWSAKTLGMHMIATHLVERTPDGSRNVLRIELSGIGARVFGPILKRKIHTVLKTENEGFRQEALRITAASKAIPQTMVH